MENENQTEMQDDLLINYLLGEASPIEMVRVENYRVRDESVNQRYLHFKALWDASKNLDGGREIDAQTALYRYKEKAKRRVDIRPRILWRKRVRVLTAIAASFLLFVGGSWLYFRLLRTKDVGIATYDQTRVATLPDETIVTMNHFSRFQYPSRFAGTQRQVRLDTGEAFFNVTHNIERPFLITTGNILIRVLGTSFNVKNKRGIVEVIVETGMVGIINGNHTLLLRTGEKLTINRSDGIIRKERNLDQLYAYYRKKQFIADNTPLWRMVEVLNEAYGSHIVIARKELNNLPLNTTFDDESLDKVLDVISRTFKITIEKKRGTILLK